jgi:hypothetical protein
LSRRPSAETREAIERRGVVVGKPTRAALVSFAQVENGKLQIHFMNVGQGNGASLISPRGETVLFDDVVRTLCDKPISYVQQFGVTKIDYHVASHYHDDQIGCAKDVLTEFPLQKAAYDRGGEYDLGTFRKYKTIVGDKRQEWMKRLHDAVMKTYWTGRGSGATPVAGRDFIGNNIVVEVGASDTTFTVTYHWTKVDSYPLQDGPAHASVAGVTTALRYAWSKKSQVYHYSECRYVQNISPKNLDTGATPPSGKRLHEGCPK